jgi:hypothetical protein
MFDGYFLLEADTDRNPYLNFAAPQPDQSAFEKFHEIPPRDCRSPVRRADQPALWRLAGEASSELRHQGAS